MFLPPEKRKNLIALLENLLSNEQNGKYFLPQGDYKELLHLLLTVVNENLFATLQTRGVINKAQ